MSKLERIIMVFDNKVKIVEGPEAEKYQKQMKNILEWAGQQASPLKVDAKGQVYVKTNN